MNQFLLFAGDEYYPGGGWSDFRGSFKTVEEAEEKANKPTDNEWGDCVDRSYDWWHIVDSDTGNYVKAHSYR
jgi:hypothetical protein